MSAAPFDLEAPLGQRRAIIRRDGEHVEMVEAAWGFDPAPMADRPYTVVRAEGRTVSSHRCLVPASEFRLRSRDRTYSFTMAGGVWSVRRHLAACETRLARSLCDPDGRGEPDVASYHDRQIAVLRREQRFDWLDSLVAEDELLRPLAAGSLCVKEVRPAFAF